MATQTNGKKIATRQSLDQAVKSICDIMRRGNCAGALQYVPELTWILFLRILDEVEEREELEAEAIGVPFRPSLVAPYRWRDWASPDGPKRLELLERTLGSHFAFVNSELIPYLKKLEELPQATTRQKVIGEIMSGVERVRIDTERNFLDVIDKVHELSHEAVDQTHVFTLSQVYEGLLLKMGEKGNDGGQFFTPREVIRFMVRALDPKVGETVYDPCSGTGGFLAQTYEYMRDQMRESFTADQLQTLKEKTFFGREKENLIYPITLANLVLHGIDKPNLWHGNTLTGNEQYGGLFEGAPGQFDVILTNPPFGGKEGKEAQTNFDFKTGATQVLFLQHCIRSLKDGGRCAIVLDEGLLFRTNEDAFLRTKRKLLDDCNVWCIVSLPGGVFTAAGAGVKTNVVFFTKGQRTEKIWYFDLSDLKVRKKQPLMLEHFNDFFETVKNFEVTERSWVVDMRERAAKAQQDAEPLRQEAKEIGYVIEQLRDELKAVKKAKGATDSEVLERNRVIAERTRDMRDVSRRADEILETVYDLKAVNPNRKAEVDDRTPQQLIDEIRIKGNDVATALGNLERLLAEANF